VNRITSYLKRKYSEWKSYVKALFKQGLSPHEVALSIALASFWGVIPLLGIATPAVTFLTLKWKLNLPIAIFTTYVLSPLHVGLFIPFIHAGEWLLGIPHLPITFDALRDGLKSDILLTLSERGWQLSYGVLGWIMITLPLSVIIYLLFKSILSRKSTSH